MKYLLCLLECGPPQPQLVSLSVFYFLFWPRRLACAMRAPCVAWPLFSPSFSLSFSLRLLLLTNFGETPCLKICFPQYFGITRRSLDQPLVPGVFLLLFLRLLLLTHFGETPVSENLLAQAACVRHACLRAPCVAWPLLLPSFSLSLSSFFSLRLLLFTHFGESPVRENLFPPIFWHN